ncbi:MAG: T4 family baseplate hub assembly chaperone [Desulfuromonadaceae bacterium]
MSLPKPILPIFNLVVPSSGKRVNYRQFTVREEKMLVQAQESDDIHTIATAVKEIIRACVEGVIIDTLSLFDVEYIVTKIRAKSVGEKIDLRLPCEADPTHEKIPVRVNLDELEVKFPEGHSNKIELWENTGVVMRYPTLDDLQAYETADGVEAIIMCIDYIYTAEEVMYAKDHTKEELVDWLESLTDEHTDRIEQTFLKTMPVLKYDLEYTCPQCGHKHKKYIKGLASFFA